MKKLVIGLASLLMLSCVSNRMQDHHKFCYDWSNLERPNDSLIFRSLLQEMDSTELGDSRNIYGVWFIPHEAELCIVLHKNHTFEDYTYHTNPDSSVSDVIIKGSFYMKGDSLIMKANKGWTKKLRHWKGGEDDNFYLTSGKGTGIEDLFVKEDDPL